MSEFNSEPIDIIVPWVNPNDPVWKKDFEYWKQKETGNKDACRYRDWGFLKFVFRSIEENCHWCRYVFLVLNGPTQIPDWLNTKCKKLKIIYHNDYIPNEFLPTFNSNIIELFYPYIEDLSDNFILANDDTFFIKETNETDFFVNDTPINYKINVRCTSNDIIMNNNLNFEKDAFGFINKNYFNTGHLQVAYNKNLLYFILSKIDIVKFKNSKFRTNNDLSHYLYYDIQAKTNHSIMKNERIGHAYPILNKQLKIDKTDKIICLNEGENSNELGIFSALYFLRNTFNKKSEFEL